MSKLGELCDHLKSQGIVKMEAIFAEESHSMFLQRCAAWYPDNGCVVGFDIEPERIIDAIQESLNDEEGIWVIDVEKRELKKVGDAWVPEPEYQIRRWDESEHQTYKAED